MRFFRFTLMLAPFALAASLAQGTIYGTVFAPAGGDVYGTVVIACYPTADGESCDEALSGYVQIGQGGASAPFEIRDLGAGAYLLLAWQDTNGSGEIDEGEPLALYSSDGVNPSLTSPPAEGIDLRFAPADAPMDKAQAQPAPTGALPAEVIGYWHRGTTSMVDFHDPITGAWAPPSGSGASYTFNIDGSYERGVMAQSSLYSCTMTLFSYQAGHAMGEANIIVLEQSVNKFKSQDTCREEWNYEREDPLETQYYLWETGVDAYGSSFLALTELVLNPQGKLEVDPESEPSVLYRGE
jgi:hypothetical protein